MRKKGKFTICSAALILIIVGIFIGIRKDNQQPSQTMLQQLIQVLEEEGYAVSYEKGNKNILAGERYVITLSEDQFLNVYLYNSDKKAKKDAGNLSDDAGTYTVKNGLSWIGANICYAFAPHYFQRGNMIVSYGGERNELYDCLENFLGEQFAGA